MAFLITSPRIRTGEFPPLSVYLALSLAGVIVCLYMTEPYVHEGDVDVAKILLLTIFYLAPIVSHIVVIRLLSLIEREVV